MAEEIKQRVTIDGADQATRDLHQVAAAEAQVAAQTSATGEVAQQAAPKIDAQAKATEELAQQSQEAAKAQGELKESSAQVSEIAQHAVSQIDKQTDATRELTQEAKAAATAQKDEAVETTKTGNAAEEAARKTDQATQAKSGLGNAIKGLMTSYVGWGALLGGVVSMIKGIGEAAVESANEVAKLGVALNRLAVQQGKQADQTLRDINQIATDQSLGVADRNQLIDAAGQLASLNPNITPDNMRAQLTRVARLRTVAGDAAGTGSQAASLLVTAQARQPDLGPDAVTDRVAAMLTAGFDEKIIGDLYRRGDMDMITAIYGARGMGLDVKKAASKILPIASAVDRRDEYGRLAPELRRAGVTQDMTTLDRLKKLDEAASAGRITPAQLTSLTGGNEAMEVSQVLMEIARDPRAMTNARTSLQGTTLADLEARRNQSEFVQAAERASARELRVQQSKESSKMGGVGEFMEEYNAGLAAQGGGSWWAGAAVSVAEKVVLPYGMYKEGQRLLQAYQQTGAQPAPSTTINIGQQYNLNSEGESPFTRPYEGKWQ